MKAPLVILIAIIVCILGFLVIYSQQHDTVAKAPAGHGGAGGYGSAPASGGYGSAPASGGYGSAPASGGYGAPATGGYGAPATGGHGAPAAGGYGR
jgi:hypothetical protein